MRKIEVISQKPGMGQRSFSQLVTPFQLVQAGFLALMIHQVKELLLTLRWPSVSGDSDKKKKTSNRDNVFVRHWIQMKVRILLSGRLDRA